jgi:hypothetical protein
MFFLDFNALQTGFSNEFFPGGVLLIILLLLRVMAEALFVFRPLINESREYPKLTRFTMLLDVLLVPLLLTFIAFAVERYMQE